jgi:hypothetical protein
MYEYDTYRQHRRDLLRAAEAARARRKLRDRGKSRSLLPRNALTRFSGLFRTARKALEIRGGEPRR